MDFFCYFEFHFSTLDIRQDSRAHAKVFNDMVDVLIESGSEAFPKNYHSLPEKDQVRILSTIKGTVDLSLISNKDTLKALKTMAAIKTIQHTNGEKAANRYIISNNQSTLHVMQLYAMLKLVAFNDRLSIDIVPLFETVTDLENAPKVMEQLSSTDIILPPNDRIFGKKEVDPSKIIYHSMSCNYFFVY